jgi:ribosomal protein S18 acetylase RimI-like enzyme
MPPTAGFHVSRMRAAPPGTPKPPPLLGLVLRVATTDAELAAAAALRAHSFYLYPPDRAFAGRLHQELKTREEYEALVAVRDASEAAGPAAGSRSACIIALAPLSAFGPPPPPLPSPSTAHPDPSDPSYPHPALHLGPDPACGGAAVAVVGTLDVAYARAVAGEDLVGDAPSAAYMANVCAAPPARRRGIGARLLAAARGAALAWGVDALYVHALAVNEVAARFYGGAGFVVEKAEAPAAAKARGHCLDGVEGLGRAVLWRDGRLRDPDVEVEETVGI